eukprot:2635762-Amphidinium_carterae.1
MDAQLALRSSKSEGDVQSWPTMRPSEQEEKSRSKVACHLRTRSHGGTRNLGSALLRLYYFLYRSS